ncbi:hypothetical protein [Microbacterium sp. CGR1]|uniref:hypothetical protein n=1 Tax=Microbacterium sp. CGR1 TaxID=1696072 RepID=UPI003DA44D33
MLSPTRLNSLPDQPRGPAKASATTRPTSSAAIAAIAWSVSSGSIRNLMVPSSGSRPVSTTISMNVAGRTIVHGTLAEPFRDLGVAILQLPRVLDPGAKETPAPREHRAN